MKTQWSVDILFFDFDGVLTDNKVFVFDDGREAVLCTRADGQGFRILKDSGIKCMIVSTETNTVVSHRARKLGVPVLQAVEDKGVAVREICRNELVPLSRAGFVGNDINDLPALRIVGVSLCPRDAVPEVRRICTFVLRTAGGAGVVREIAARQRKFFV
jgi:3-deoxy-D-manno-octulosonate 8-phosphate phosphatase (KDO 8-P phosphatase)